MAKLNKKAEAEKKYTGGGGLAALHLTPEQQLRRLVMANMLWENNFYSEGKDIADAIQEACEHVSPTSIAAIAIEARKSFNLRHVPLLLLAALCKRGAGTSLVSDTISTVISRADELAEFVAVYAQYNGVKPNAVKKKLSAQAKKGLAKAFGKFDEYQLGKYNRDGEIKLRDVLFLCHAKPADAARESLYKKLVAGELATPDTWEVALSSGANKKETWERLIREDKLGYFALLRNLRNMVEAKCDPALVKKALLSEGNGKDKILPFRFVAAARACPQFEPEIDEAMLSSLSQRPKLKGKTLVVIDTSGSMNQQLSSKSDMTRMDAACALGAILRELCEDARIYATAGHGGARVHATALVPARRGMALIDATQSMRDKIGGGGIFLNQVCKFLKQQGETDSDRMIVITDEQDCSSEASDSASLADPLGKSNYLINVASERNGIGYGKWTHIDGFSENVIKYISEFENAKEN